MCCVCVLWVCVHIIMCLIFAHVHFLSYASVSSLCIASNLTTYLFFIFSDNIQRNHLHILKVSPSLSVTLYHPCIHSGCLSPSVGYMWACLHDQRNAKSSPDHYNMPCVHNLHEIHIHSWHACTWNSFSLPLFPYLICFYSPFLLAWDVFSWVSLSNKNIGIIYVTYSSPSCLLSSLFYS